MLVIAGHFNIQRQTTNTLSFPVLSHTRITAQYQDTMVLLQNIQHASLQEEQKEPELFHDRSMQIVAVADAHLLNRRSLSAQLNRPDSKYLSDAELIVYAYQKWNTDCVHHFIGPFSFAIYDIKKQQLIIARDISGQRSLFYCIDANQTFYFASLPRFLFELNGFHKQINPIKVADYLTLLPGQNSTFFKNIQSVPAGHLLTLNTTCLKPILKPYWSPSDLIQNQAVFDSREDCYDAFQTLFSEVMSDYVSSQGITACHLSGGLDSSAVTCMAAHLLQDQNQTVAALCHVPGAELSVSHYANWTMDDTVFMQAVERQYPNVKNHYLNGYSRYLFDYCEEINPWLDSPTLNPSNNLWWLEGIDKARDLNASVILTGQRGNSTISWPGPLSTPAILSWKHVRHLLAKKYKAYLAWSLRHRLSNPRPWQHFSGISDDLACNTGLFNHYYNRINIKNELASSDLRDYVPLHMIDRLGSSAFPNTIRFLYGVELMDPSADKRIVEFCLRMPPAFFYDKSQSRLLVRRGLAKQLPPCIRERTSRGIQTADWYVHIDKQQHELKQRLVSWKNTLVSDYIDTQQLIGDLARWDVEMIKRSRGKQYRHYVATYQNKLLRSIEVGLFIERHFL